VTASSLVKTFWVMNYIDCRGSKIVFHNMDFMAIKRRRILCRFQKYKHTLVTKCTKKRFQDKDFCLYTGGPVGLKQKRFFPFSRKAKMMRKWANFREISWNFRFHENFRFPGSFRENGYVSAINIFKMINSNGNFRFNPSPLCSKEILLSWITFFRCILSLR
jgi:hypothetical protein